MTMEPLYDLSKLNEIGKGNPSFIRKMISLFIDQGPKSVEEIAVAHKAGDLEKVKAVAHRIKPSIDNMGIISLTHEIRRIETIAAAGTHSGELKDLIGHLEDTMNKVVAELKML